MHRVALAICQLKSKVLAQKQQARLGAWRTTHISDNKQLIFALKTAETWAQ
jgi:hypothetical protein